MDMVSPPIPIARDRTTPRSEGRVLVETKTMTTMMSQTEMTEELGSHQPNAAPLVEEMRNMRRMIWTAYLVVRMRTQSHHPRRKQRA
jgi:hypothetical protein